MQHAHLYGGAAAAAFDAPAMSSSAAAGTSGADAEVVPPPATVVGRLRGEITAWRARVHGMETENRHLRAAVAKLKAAAATAQVAMVQRASEGAASASVGPTSDLSRGDGGDDAEAQAADVEAEATAVAGLPSTVVELQQQLVLEREAHVRQLEEVSWTVDCARSRVAVVPRAPAGSNG